MTVIWRFILVAAALVVIPQSVVAADLSMAPGAGQTTVGSVISAMVRVDTAGSAVNAVEATVTFPTELLRLIAVSKTDSILSLATIESADANETGRIRISGGLPSPGYDGDQGTLFKVTWETLAAGQANIQISDGKILANDGVGTNIVNKQTGAIYSILDPTTTSKPSEVPVVGSLEYPDETKWYTPSSASVYWSNPAGLEGVSYVLNRQSGTVPDESIDTTDNATTITLTEDGIWYFHLRGKYSTGWSASAHFILRHDSTPPEQFEIDIQRDRGAADPSPDIVFSTTDNGSGLAGYTVSIDGEPAKSVSSPFKVQATRAGDYQVVITATDKAGNIRVSATTFSVDGHPGPIITSVSSPIILLETLTVRGTALAGDRVNIFIDGHHVGSINAGTPETAVNDGTTVRLPWTFTTDEPIRPGTHRVTATATNPAGQTSVPSDPRQVVVQGTLIQVGGRTLGTFATVPLVGFIFVVTLMALTWLVWRMRLGLQKFEQQQTMVDKDLRTLRQAVDEGRLSTRGIEEALTIIDDEVVGQQRARSRKRRSKPPRA